jgi:NADH:ubiquinone oxidoreductase subunit H
MTSLPSTLISLIEVVLVLVPALLSVAYVTVAERKTMASMQRRLGPNAVGQNIVFTSFKIQTRFYHTTSHDNSIKALWKNRKVPLIPFNQNVISVCEDLLYSTTLNTFL